jgi:ElaB/YqjD/DUF883 family membrane-anchored ribosome-binding protein
MTTTIESAKEAVSDRLEPALESLEDAMRGARRTMRQGRHAAEDLAESTALQVRRHPLPSVGVAGAVGLLIGCLFGFALGRMAHPGVHERTQTD